MGNLRIEEYDPSYAKAVAEMWQKSSEGWNGEWGNETEESVLKMHEGATNINTFLAVENEDVLGYCSFSKYLEDEGALYIKTLNVRFDKHGTGIGRTLVTKCIERTIELDWPRLDIYTWPGNTKSLPLYKRCGFFLEKRDDTTHLINFIPTAVKTEAVQEYFKDLHWYKDLKRNIDMEPDGREKDDYSFYEYVWENDDKKLRMEFERKCRGLRLIETEDYIISVSIPQQQLVFGTSYKVKYEILNKSGKPLSIEIIGKDNKNIKFDLNKKVEVKDKEEIEGEFYVSEIKEEFNTFKTHPAVSADVFINGKKASFKTGVIPKFPIDIKLSGTNSECYLNKLSKLYLDIENNFNEEVQLSFELKDCDDIKFQNKYFNLKLNDKEKRSIEVGYILNRFAFYSSQILIIIKLASGKKVEFNKNLKAMFRGRNGGAFGGELEDCFMVCNGEYTVKLSKISNKLFISNFDKSNETIFFNFPKLGLPYSLEFSTMKPEKVEWYKDDEFMILKTTYVSQTFKDIEVSSVIKVACNGVILHNYEVKNTSENHTNSEIWLKHGLYSDLSNVVIPYDNKYMRISEAIYEDIEEFNCDRISENWIFENGYSTTRGIYWDESLKMILDEWMMGFEHNLGIIKANSTVNTKNICIALNTFNNFNEFRNFALRKTNKNLKTTIEDFELRVNNGNPFVKSNFIVEAIEHKNFGINGELTLKSKSGNIKECKRTFNNKDEVFKCDFEVSIKNDVYKDVLELEMDSNLLSYKKEALVFNIKEMECKEKTTEEMGHKVYSFSNGVIEIKASPSFSSSLYSMKFNNHEWLESSFPTPRTKSWFNHWCGGIQNLPEEMGFKSILDEKNEADFVRLKDCFGNIWRGLKINTRIERNEDFKGISINQYFIMQSGIPILCNIVEIEQNTSSFMDTTTFENLSFFNIDQDIKDNWVMVKNRISEFVKYKVGRESCDIEAEESLMYGSNNINEKIQIFTDFHKVKTIGFINTKDTACIFNEKLSGKHGEKIFTTPIFYIFTDEYIDDKYLKNLKNIRFI